ncbi:MAG: thiamine phosphate synthase [Candidatus Sumerlaeaceae bacterium]
MSSGQKHQDVGASATCGSIGAPESRKARCIWGIYVITDARLAGRPHAELCKEIVAGGGRVLQLRDKRLSRDELRPIAREIRKITADHGVIFIVNDDPYLAAEVEADGVHVGQEDLDVPAVRAIVGEEKIVGLSTHNIAQAFAAEKLSVDYIGVGPIFPTRTKENPWPTVGVELIHQVRQKTSHVITAIGGIREEHIRDLVIAGAHNIALIGDVMTAPNIREKVSRLCELYTQALEERCKPRRE